MTCNLVGCAGFGLRPEPAFIPVIYVTSPNSSAVVNSSEPHDVILPNTKEWNGLYCAPVDELLKIKAKFQRCAKWE